MPFPSIIAIDGPAGSGKSTVGQRLAAQLGYLYFDTGVMYRAVTREALRRGVSIDDEAAVTALAGRLKIDVTPPTVDDGRQYTVLVGGRDATWELRAPEVDAHVSPVSAYPGVRSAMTELQRQIGLRGRVVMVGRDIGTVVLPDADLKVYLDASVEVRARRRHQECLERGETRPFEEILAGLRERDRIDSTRDVAPLRPADDAVRLDTSAMSVNQVVARLLALVIADC